jgi:tetratricopeptide (TPR) repeat protein
LTKRGRKRPQPGRRRVRPIWILIFLAVLAVAFDRWISTSWIPADLPRFDFLLMSKNGLPVKLLKGETLHLHPRDRVRILKVSTNLCLNRGVRLVGSDLDVNALFHEDMLLAALLPDHELFKTYHFRVRVKQYNNDLGHVDFIVQSPPEDWLRRAEKEGSGPQRLVLLERALKSFPENDRLRRRLIEEYKSLGRWQQAATLLEPLAGESAGDDVLYELLEVYRATANADGVIRVLGQLETRHPNDLDMRVQRASSLEEAGRTKEAIRAYEDLLGKAAEKDKLGFYRTLGYLYSETGQTEKAISSYLRAADLDPSDVNLYYNLSILHERAGKKDQAFIFLEKAVGLKPEDSESRLRLAEGSLDQGELSKAERHLREVLSKNPSSVRALLLMIRVLERKEDKKGLREYYERLLALDPKNETVLFNLGALEYEKGNLASSVSYFEKFQKMSPSDGEVHRFLLDIYTRLGKEDLAFQEALALIRMNPREAAPYAHAFEYLSHRGRYEEIVGIMKSGLKSSPGNVEFRQYLVLAYLKADRLGPAIQQIQKLLESRPKDITLLMQMANLQEKLGKLQEAMDIYKQVMKIAPGHEEAGEMYLRLRIEVLRGGRRR